MTVCPWCGKDSGAKPNAQRRPHVPALLLQVPHDARAPGRPVPRPAAEAPARRSRYVVHPTRMSVSGRLGPMAPRPSKRQSRATVRYPDRSRRTP